MRDAIATIQLQVIGASLRSIAEEMGAVLIRSSFSANIKERRDCSTALFDERGRMIAQAEHIPVHLGAMPDAVAAVIRLGLGPGVYFLLVGAGAPLGRVLASSVARGPILALAAGAARAAAPVAWARGRGERAGRLGESSAAHRIGDLGALIPSTTGKVELEALNEEAPEERVVDRLLSKALYNVFGRLVSVDDLDPIVTAFDGGLTVETGESIASREYVRWAREIPGLAESVRRLGGGPSPASVASG